MVEKVEIENASRPKTCEKETKSKLGLSVTGLTKGYAIGLIYFHFHRFKILLPFHMIVTCDHHHHKQELVSKR